MLDKFGRYAPLKRPNYFFFSFELCSGAVGARLSTDASTMRSIVGDALALIVQNVATITAGLLIAFIANWILALIVIAVSPLILAQGFIQARFLKGFSADAKVCLAFLNGPNCLHVMYDFT